MDVALLLGYAAISLMVFYILSSVCGPSASPPSPEELERGRRSAPPAELRVLTKAELRRYNGSEEGLPILIGIKGRLFDVSSRDDFYGKGQGYNVFTGHDASRALAKTSLDPRDVETSNVDDLTFTEEDTLRQWEATFEQKYHVWGYVVEDEAAKAEKEAELAALNKKGQ